MTLGRRLICGSLLLTAACAGTHIQPPAITTEFQAPPGSMAPSLSRTPGGRALLTWIEPAADGQHALRLAIRDAGRWSAPVTVRQSPSFFVNWADFASAVETADGRILVHWLERTAASTYAYHVMLSVSGDDGRTWTEPFPAHRDLSPTEHGFVAMVPRPPGQVGADLAWLDGRRMGGDPPGPMTVRTTSLGSGTTLGPEVMLDDRTCECCQVALARTAQGLVAAYRDRSPDEIRDIAVVREVDGAWTAPTIVAPDGWEHRACPVNGPALAADGVHLALAWYTGVNDDPAVWLIQSADAGATFGSRLRVDGGGTLGRIHLAPLGAGAVAVVWLERDGPDEGRWLVRRVESDGRVGPTVPVASSVPARPAGFPRIVAIGPELLFAYTMPEGDGDAGGVRVLALDQPPPAGP